MMDLKHSGEVKLKIIFHKQGAARLGRKNAIPGREPHVLRVTSTSVIWVKSDI